ncbi:MAG: hypothetical protein JSU86_03615 [Phycisphaerales bacterium]|nr:MAG: hypothetical protein JSU86_03615 [Phycisphaerales bacterium]
MSEASYNPNDPAFLLSRSLDEDLPDHEERRLDEALASSESLRSEAMQLRAVDRLVRRWGARPAGLDHEHHAALVVAQAAGGEDVEALRKVDQLIERWGSRGVPYDEERFTAAVIGKVARETGRTSRRGLVFRLGAPLAAAAAIAFAVIGGVWWPSHRQAVCVVELGPIATALAPHTNADGGSGAIVSFGRAPIGEVTGSPVQRRISFGTVGATPPAALPAESPPL